MSEAEVKAGLNGTNGFAMPLFGLPKIALPSMFSELSEQGVARAKEGCEKIKAASEEMAEALRETYSSNARSTTDYGLKVIEISNANTAAAIDFFAHLLGSKSPTDVFSLSAAQAQRLSTPHRPKARTCGSLPRGSRRKPASRSGSASPRCSTRATKKRALNIQRSFRRVTRPVGISPATSKLPQATRCSSRQRAGARCPQVGAPTRGANPTGRLFCFKTKSRGGSHGYGHGQMPANRTGDPYRHQDRSRELSAEPGVFRAHPLPDLPHRSQLVRTRSLGR